MNFNLPKIPDYSMLKPIAQKIAEDNYASRFANEILKQVNDFDNIIGEEYAVGIRLANFGQAVQFPVAGIGYIDPSLIIFYGVDNDNSPCELIQHVSQISFALTSFKREDTTKPKEPIGFRLCNEVNNCSPTS